MKIASVVLLMLCACGVWIGCQPASIAYADEPLVYSAPICCEVKIPGCYCWPTCGDPWPEPPCPSVWLGLPMGERPAGETWPAFCAVVDSDQGRGKITRTLPAESRSPNGVMLQ